MNKILLTALLVLGFALAQTAEAKRPVDHRLGVLETSMTTVEADVSTLEGVNFSTVGVTIVSSATTPVSQQYVVSPIAGSLTRILCVNNDLTTVGESILTPKVNGVTTSTLTVPTATGIGNVVSVTVSSSNTLAAGQTIELETDGGATDGGTLNCTFVITH